MKNKGLILALIGVGAFFLLSAKKKPKKRAYTISVPPPEKITAEQYKQATKGLVQKIAPKILDIFKPKPKLTAQQQQAIKTLSTRRIFGSGDFPDVC